MMICHQKSWFQVKFILVKMNLCEEISEKVVDIQSVNFAPFPCKSDFCKDFTFLDKCFQTHFNFSNEKGKNLMKSGITVNEDFSGSTKRNYHIVD